MFDRTLVVELRDFGQYSRVQIAADRVSHHEHGVFLGRRRSDPGRVVFDQREVLHEGVQVAGHLRRHQRSDDHPAPNGHVRFHPPTRLRRYTFVHPSVIIFLRARFVPIYFHFFVIVINPSLPS